MEAVGWLCHRCQVVWEMGQVRCGVCGRAKPFHLEHPNVLRATAASKPPKPKHDTSTVQQS